jgi:formate hydrogenlyase subunit 3/multisubunit Na+/H+ antiporter MnhD subunit
MHETFTIGWGTLALINAAIAQSKNRSGAMWLASSVLLGPLATALLVLLPRYEATPESQAREQKVEKRLGIVNMVLVALIVTAILVAMVRKFLA